MSNRIRRLHVRDRSLDPAQAELWLTAETDHVTATTELRGRLTGPLCRYAATVEVAYPLRPFARRPEGLDGPAARVVIPEPSLWDPEGPYLYHATIELWEDGVRCDATEIRRGLRRILLGPHGLRVNGRAMTLRGSAGTPRPGCSLLLKQVVEEAMSLWERADWEGFFVLGAMKHIQEAHLVRAVHLLDHPSCFGWLLQMPSVLWNDGAVSRLRDGGRAKVGVELEEPPAGPLPGWVDFVACPPKSADGLRGLGRPLLLIGEGPDAPESFGRVV